MPRLSKVALSELDGIACPYCGRVMAKDSPRAISAATVWGWCGVRLAVEGRTEGVLLLTPFDEPGQAMVTSLWVLPGSTGAGYGRQLVQAAAAGLAEQKARAIVARGSRSNARCEAPPREFLRSVGFSRGHDDRLWRLDLERTVTGERNGVRNVFERFLDSLRPVTPPEPAGGAISGRVNRF